MTVDAAIDPNAPFKLSLPVDAHGEQLTELKVRRPTVAEVRAIKSLPYAIGKDEEVSLNMDACAKYIAVCAGIPPSSVNELDLVDLNNLSWQIAGFFMTAASKKPNA